MTIHFTIFAGHCGVSGSKITGHCGVTLSNSRPRAQPLWRPAAKNVPSVGHQTGQKNAMVVELAQKRNTDCTKLTFHNSAYYMYVLDGFIM